MRLFDVIDASPWPTLPVFLASALMPFVYVAMASAQHEAGPEGMGLPDAVMVTVLVRIALHLALKLPAALAYARQRPGADPMLSFVAICASIVLSALVWTNSAATAQAIWSAAVCMIGLIELWHAMHRHDVTPGGPVGRAVGRDTGPDHTLMQAINLLLFSVICAGLSALASTPVWVAYAAMGWILQHWLLALAWSIATSGASACRPPVR